VLKEDAGIISKEYAGFKVYKDKKGVTGELFQIPVGEIDILYRNSKGRYLVVELKRTDEEPDKVVGQTARYMGWIGENLAKKGNVKGAIIARSHSTKLRYAVKALRSCRLYSFSVDFLFKKE
jgi:restriction system protein